MRVPISLHQLEAIVRVAESRSFRKAADAMHISQPALSRTIAAAEDVLNTRLFDRDTRNVRITQAGEQLLPIARRILSEFESSLGELGNFLAGHQGRIVVATLPSVGNALLPQAIADFVKETPGVEFSIKAVSSQPVWERVSNGEADFGICMQPPANLKLHFEHLLDDEFVLLCAADHPLSKKKEGRWEMFTQYPYIAEASATSIRILSEAVFRELQLKVQPAFECENLSLCGKLVAVGLGVTAMPRLVLSQFDLANIRIKPLRERHLVRSLGIVTRVGRTASPAARRFQKLVVKHAQVAWSASRSL